jgi:hypothetical protein
VSVFYAEYSSLNNYAEYHYVECHLCCITVQIIVLGVFMLSVIMLNIVATASQEGLLILLILQD